MIKRTVEISRQATHLSIQHEQLCIQPFDAPKDTATTIPCEDIGLLLVDHPATTYSHATLETLARYGAAVVICGRNHLPSGILLPLSNNSEIVPRIHDQIDAPKPLVKRIWQQIVVAKIKAQAANLEQNTSPHRKLLKLARTVRSGDPSNVEAHAARVYWQEIFPPDINFRRNRNSSDPVNVLLNYGYTVMRAAVARVLVAAGLMPAIGIHHCNRSNAFCLADDLVEPLRPLVDARVVEIIESGDLQLTQFNKAKLLDLLTIPTLFDGQQGPLMVNLHRMAASLVRCYQKTEKKLLIPIPLDKD